MSAQTLLPVHRRTVFTPHGVGDLGHITVGISEKTGLKPGSIRLLQGFESSRGGFGRAHIEAHVTRMKQLLHLGFRDAISYVYHVASDIELIALHANGRISIIRTGNGLFHQVVCQWDDAFEIWSVTTAIPKNSLRNLQILWRKN